jgi:putative tricarboxylic transport membrane protein
MTGAIAWFVFGAVTAALSLQYPLGTLRAPGSGFFPLVLGLMLMGLAVAHAVKLRLERRKPEIAPTAAPDATSAQRGDATRRVLLFIGVVALSTALLQTIGYVASSFLLMLGLLRVLGERWRVAVLVAAASTIASHFVFVRWLSIPMPPGPLGF